MKRRLSRVWIALLVGGSWSMAACDDAPSTDGKDGDASVVVPPGSVSVHVKTSGDTAPVVATYAASGPSEYRASGTFFVSPDAAESTRLTNVPVGDGYSLTVAATTADGATVCSGTKSFAVASMQTTDVHVDVTCTPVPHTGSVLENGIANVCPVLDGASASSMSAVVGEHAALTGTAHDPDASGTLAYQWTASAGSFDDAASRTPVFTCSASGTVTVSLVVSDGDPLPSCRATKTFTIDCLPKSTTTLALYGDWPYSSALFMSAPKLISSVNTDPDVELVVHVGDIHSGSMPCDDAWNQSIYDLFQQFQDPFVYTPGDNEWTDCQKVKEMSSGAPLDQLSRIRTLFFATPGQTLGIGHRAVISQASSLDATYAADAEYVENVLWSEAGVVFVTLNFPGSDNDTLPWNGTFSDPTAQAAEVARRTDANIRWINRAFAQANASGAAGVFIATQADMWDPAAAAVGGDGLDAYTPFINHLAALTVEFGKPVFLVNGDSHVYEGDHPLADPTSPSGMIHHVPYAVPNLERVTVEGSTAADEWVKLHVDSTTPEVFSWSRVMYVP